MYSLFPKSVRLSRFHSIEPLSVYSLSKVCWIIKVLLYHTINDMQLFTYFCLIFVEHWTDVEDTLQAFSIHRCLPQGRDV